MEQGIDSPQEIVTPARGTIYTLNAYHLAEKIPIKEVIESYSHRVIEQCATDAMFQFGPDSYLVVYNFGAASFFNVDASTQKDVVATIKSICRAAKQELMSDDFQVVLDAKAREGVHFDRVVVNDLDRRKILIIAMVLAHSVTLDHYERVVEDLLDQAESITTPLKTTGRLPLYTRRAMRYIGISLSTRRDLISWLYILDAPDETWDDRDLDRLFHLMKSNMEVDARFRALEYKLKLIQEGVEVIVDLTNAQRNILLEVTIVILIVVEIILAMRVIH